MIRRFPNGETQLRKPQLSWEQSKDAYSAKWNISVAEGKEKKFIPLVAASEKGDSPNWSKFSQENLDKGCKIKTFLEF